MGSSSNLSIKITASDMASNVLKGVTAPLDRMGSVIGGVTGAVGGLVTGLGKLGLAGLGVQALAGAFSGLGEAMSISAASDLNESMSKAEVVFGDAADGVKKFAETAAQGLGQSKREAMAALGTFGNLFVTMGLGQKDAAGLSTNIVGLASDLASFNNLNPTEVLDKLRAGLVGEAEPLRALGIAINADAVAAKGLQMGLADANGELSEAAKVQARYALIMEQSKTAQGDFARTSTGLANAQRIISASFDDIRTNLGTQLLPVVASVTSAFAKALPGAMTALQPIFNGIGQAVQRFAGFLQTAGGYVQAFLGYLSPGNSRDLMREWFGDFGPKVDQFVLSLQRAGEIVGHFLQNIMAGDWGMLGELLSEYFNVDIGPLISGLQQVGAALSSVYEIARYLVTGDYRGGIFGLFEDEEPILWLFQFRDAMGSLAGAFGGVLESIKTVAGGLGEVLSGKLDFGAWLSQSIGSLATSYQGYLSALFALIGSAVQPIAQKLGEWAGAFIAWLVPAAVQFLQAWPGLLNKVLDVIETAVPKIVGQLAEWAGAFWEWVSPMLPDLVRAIMGIQVAILLFIGETLITLGQRLLQWGAAFVDWVGPQIGPLLGELGELLGQAVGWMVSTGLPTLQTELGKWASAFVDWVGPKIPPLLAELLILLQKVRDWIWLTALPAIVEKLGEWGGAFLDWVGPAATTLVTETLPDLWSRMSAWMGETALPAIKTKAVEWGGALVQGILDGLGDLAGRLQQFISDAIGRIRLPSISIDVLIPDWVQKLLNGGGGGGDTGSSTYRPQSLSPTFAPIGGGVRAPSVAPMGGGGGNVYVTVNVAGSVTTERDLAASVREELLRIGRRNVSVLSEFA